MKLTLYFHKQQQKFAKITYKNVYRPILRKKKKAAYIQYQFDV